jgi:hypothetical protein|tara:strand:- start:317 stop:916 length:600 start_codon:yes stop_codon:yes gene_type:complete
MSRIILTNQASSPDDAGAGKAQLFAKNDGKMYKQIGTGAETVLVNGQVLQVVQTVFTDVWTTSTATFVNSPLSGVITPASASSKILVKCSMMLFSTNVGPPIRIARKISGGSQTYPIVSDHSDYEQAATMWASPWNGSNYHATCTNYNYLDSPSTTSEIEYNIQTLAPDTYACYLNKTTSTASYSFYGTSEITLMEISG